MYKLIAKTYTYFSSLKKIAYFSGLYASRWRRKIDIGRAGMWHEVRVAH